MRRGHTDCRRFFTRATTTLRCSSGIWLPNFTASRSRRSCTTTASTYHSSTSIPHVPDRPTGRCCTEEASAPLLLTSRWPPATRKAGPQNKHTQILHPFPSKCFPSSKTSTVRHNKDNLEKLSPTTSKNLKAQQEVDHQNFDDPKAFITHDKQAGHSFCFSSFLHFISWYRGHTRARLFETSTCDVTSQTLTKPHVCLCVWTFLFRTQTFITHSSATSFVYGHTHTYRTHTNGRTIYTCAYNTDMIHPT